MTTEREVLLDRTYTAEDTIDILEDLERSLDDFDVPMTPDGRPMGVLEVVLQWREADE